MESINLNQLHNELTQIKQLMVTKEQMSKIIETIEILSSPETLKQVYSSREGIKKREY